MSKGTVCVCRGRWHSRGVRAALRARRGLDRAEPRTGGPFSSPIPCRSKWVLVKPWLGLRSIWPGRRARGRGPRGKRSSGRTRKPPQEPSVLLGSVGWRHSFGAFRAGEPELPGLPVCSCLPVTGPRCSQALRNSTWAPRGMLRAHWALGTAGRRPVSTPGPARPGATWSLAESGTRLFPFPRSEARPSGNWNSWPPHPRPCPTAAGRGRGCGHLPTPGAEPTAPRPAPDPAPAYSALPGSHPARAGALALAGFPHLRTRRPGPPPAGPAPVPLRRGTDSWAGRPGSEVTGRGQARPGPVCVAAGVAVGGGDVGEWTRGGADGRRAARVAHAFPPPTGPRRAPGGGHRAVGGGRRALRGWSRAPGGPGPRPHPEGPLLAHPAESPTGAGLGRCPQASWAESPPSEHMTPAGRAGPGLGHHRC